jgi:hypothetical protein
LKIDGGRGLKPRRRHGFFERPYKGTGIHHASFCWAIFRWSWTMP